MTPGKCHLRGARNDHSAWSATTSAERRRRSSVTCANGAALAFGVTAAYTAPPLLHTNFRSAQALIHSPCQFAAGQRVHQPHPAAPPVVALDVDRVVVGRRVLLLLLLGHVPEAVVPAAVPARQLGVVTEHDGAGAVGQPPEQAVEGDPVAAVGRELQVDPELAVRDLEVVEVRAAGAVAGQGAEPLVGRVDPAVGPLGDEHRAGRPQAVDHRALVGLGDERAGGSRAAGAAARARRQATAAWRAASRRAAGPIASARMGRRDGGHAWLRCSGLVGRRTPGHR